MITCNVCGQGYKSNIDILIYGCQKCCKGNFNVNIDKYRLGELKMIKSQYHRKAASEPLQSTIGVDTGPHYHEIKKTRRSSKINGINWQNRGTQNKVGNHNIGAKAMNCPLIRQVAGTTRVLKLLP